MTRTLAIAFALLAMLPLAADADSPTAADRVEALVGRAAGPVDLDAIAPDAGGWRCGTQAIAGALSDWEALDDESRRRINAALAFGDGPGGDTPPVAAADGRFPRPGYPTPDSFTTEHFNIKWGTIDPPTEEEVESLAEGLETTWAVEVEDEGYPVPTNSDTYLVDVYVGNTGADGENVPAIDFTGAYASEYWEDGGYQEPHMAYIVFHRDVVSNLDYAQVVAAHEFFHVLQAAIKDEHPGAYQDPGSRWFVEATAVWVTDLVYPDSNDYISVLASYMRAPQESMHHLSDSHPYSMCIWPRYLQENHGGTAAIHTIWTEPDDDGLFTRTDDYLAAESGTDLKAAMRDFAARVALRDFEEGEAFHAVSVEGYVGDYPHVQQKDDLDAESTPRVLGANFFKLTPPDQPGTLRIDFEGTRSRNELDVDWNIAVVAVDPDGDWTVRALETEDESEAGSVEIEGFGADVASVWLVPSPTPGDLLEIAQFSTQKGVPYAWAAMILPADAGDDDDDDSSEPGDDDGGGGCGI